MDPSAIIFQLILGIASAMLYWIVSSGLTFTFGVTRVLNFAHGAFYMLGAYFTLTIFELTQNYIFSLFFGAVLVALIGAACERGLISRIYGLPVPFQLTLTFGLVLVFDDLVRIFWGSVPKMMPPQFVGSINVLGRALPIFSVYLIIAGIAIALIMYFLLSKTDWGMEIRAITVDPETAVCSGLNPTFLYATAFMFGSFFAGLGGGLYVPISSAAPGMGEHVIIYAFIVTVIGGLGSIKGAFISALIIGIIESLGALFVPWMTIALPYIALAAVLILRPEGIFGEK
ncbi:branched-chain amino acid ABC transporter permease [Archaeoglobales archaeon ex4484_92]|nr:MAG: branched-chain amino acid ABC transporter permease [Archaeoglobales archaeon ex4484_92]HDN73863.1 branched-chain amino acid ABC transporter permease [Archaeoglobus sp.]